VLRSETKAKEKNNDQNLIDQFAKVHAYLMTHRAQIILAQK